MKELQVSPGDDITDACKRLAKAAPAFMIFNTIRVEADPGDAPGDLVAQYRSKMDTLQAESEKQRKEFDATPEGQKRIAEARRAQEERDRLQDETMKAVEASGVRTKYPWTKEMGEISGFGGGYESACLDMVYAGLAWLEKHPNPELKATTYQNVYGILNAVSDDAKALEKAMTAACPDCSGAMHQATMSIVMYIAKNGWTKFVEARTKVEAITPPR